jgi:hypothetical protein
MSKKEMERFIKTATVHVLYIYIYIYIYIHTHARAGAHISCKYIHMVVLCGVGRRQFREDFNVKEKDGKVH